MKINVNNDFCTDCFGMNFEISGTGSVNIETWQF